MYVLYCIKIKQTSACFQLKDPTSAQVKSFNKHSNFYSIVKTRYEKKPNIGKIKRKIVKNDI